jgi:hypothetical protein
MVPKSFLWSNFRKKLNNFDKCFLLSLSDFIGWKENMFCSAKAICVYSFLTAWQSTCLKIDQCLEALE